MRHDVVKWQNLKIYVEGGAVLGSRATSPELIELGERIRKRRQEMNLSQEALAEKAGISINTVSH